MGVIGLVAPLRPRNVAYPACPTRGVQPFAPRTSLWTRTPQARCLWLHNQMSGLVAAAWLGWAYYVPRNPSRRSATIDVKCLLSSVAPSLPSKLPVWTREAMSLRRCTVCTDVRTAQIQVLQVGECCEMRGNGFNVRGGKLVVYDMPSKTSHAHDQAQAQPQPHTSTATHVNSHTQPHTGKHVGTWHGQCRTRWTGEGLP